MYIYLFGCSMQVLFSPAKKQEYGLWQDVFPIQEPIFKNEIKILQKYLKTKNVNEISQMMGISEQLSNLNYQRFQVFGDSWARDNTGPAILSFSGDAYKSLAAKSFTVDDLLWANKQVLIISGLYGLIRPLDPIQYYRLEMKTKLNNFEHKNLYDFWGSRLRNFVDKRSEPIVNLASGEYFKALDNESAITIDFKDAYNGGFKTIGLKAKKARGQMLSWIIKNKISNPEDLKDFNLGYNFTQNLSDDKFWVFIRN